MIPRPKLPVRPYPPKPKPLPKRKPVTIAIGLLCQHGGVIAAESQETLHNYWKRRQTKIECHTVGSPQDLTLAVAGAGRGGYIDALVDGLCEAAIDGEGLWAETEAIIRAYLVKFYQEHVAPFPDLPEVQLAILMQKGTHLASLLLTDRSTLAEPSDQFGAVGIGQGHALTILNRAQVDRTILTFDAAIALAAYVVHHTKRHVADCGDVTNIIGIQNGKSVEIPPDAIRRMDDEFDFLLETTQPALIGELLGVTKADPKLGRRLARARAAIIKASQQRMKIRPTREVVVGTLPSNKLKPKDQ